MGRFISVMLVLLAVRSAAAGETCLMHDAGPFHVEWGGQGQVLGARIVSRDPRWELEEFDWHGTSSVVCKTCADDQLYGGFLWLALNGPSRRDLEQAVAPGATESRMRRVFGTLRSDFRAEGDAVAAAIGTLQGRGRVIAIRDPNGRVNHVISLAVAEGCVELFGILSTKNGAELSPDRLRAFASAIDVERYQPVLEPTPSPKGSPPKGPPPGDVRRGPEQKQRKSLR
jgi:hypothetical protein